MVDVITWARKTSAGIATSIVVGGTLTVDPDRPVEEKDRRVDWVGSGLITCGLVFIVFVLSDATATAPGLRQRIRTLWEFPGSTADLELLLSFIVLCGHPMGLVAASSGSAHIGISFHRNYLHLSPVLTMVRTRSVIS